MTSLFLSMTLTTNFLLRDSNYIVDVVMWPKFVNYSISMREVIITSILYRFDQKKGGCCFKVNNLGLTLVMALQLLTSVAKGSKLKVTKFLGLMATLVEVTGEKLVEKTFLSPFTPILIWVNTIDVSNKHLRCVFESLFTPDTFVSYKKLSIM